MKQSNYDFIKKLEDHMIRATMEIGAHVRHVSKPNRKRIVEIIEEETENPYSDSIGCGNECLKRLWHTVKPLFDAHVNDAESRGKKVKGRKDNDPLLESDGSQESV